MYKAIVKNIIIIIIHLGWQQLEKQARLKIYFSTLTRMIGILHSCHMDVDFLAQSFLKWNRQPATIWNIRKNFYS